MNRNETSKLKLGHAPKGQAITTRYFAKKQNELIHTVLSFVQLSETGLPILEDKKD